MLGINCILISSLSAQKHGGGTQDIVFMMEFVSTTSVPKFNHVKRTRCAQTVLKWRLPCEQQERVYAPAVDNGCISGIVFTNQCGQPHCAGRRLQASFGAFRKQRQRLAESGLGCCEPVRERP